MYSPSEIPAPKKSNFGSIINSFLNASRQISNTYESNSNTPKIQQIANNIEKHESKSSLVILISINQFASEETFWGQ